MPICPDCRGSVELEKHKHFYHIDKRGFEVSGEYDPYYKCPKCKAEFEQEDVEEG